MKHYPEEPSPNPSVERMLDVPERSLFCMIKLKLYAGKVIEMKEK